MPDLHETAQRIVAALVLDFTDRSGLDNAWDSCSEEIQEEIVDEWTGIVERELTGNA